MQKRGFTHDFLKIKLQRYLLLLGKQLSHHMCTMVANPKIPHFPVH